jgi:osmotically inducible protein OsmC
MKRFGSAAWSGNLRNGSGSVSTESGALDDFIFTFFSRYGDKPGTNPEELIGAAHAACFTMSFVRMLGTVSLAPEHLDAKSVVEIEKDGEGFSITSVHLSVSARIPEAAHEHRNRFRGYAASEMMSRPLPAFKTWRRILAEHHGVLYFGEKQDRISASELMTRS